MNGCRSFKRSELIRAGFARAGRGLPAIEPGQPMPAGSGMDRRAFLARGLGVGLSVYGASRLPLAAFEEGMAYAATPDDPILISIFLAGGADPLSLLAPVGDSEYARLRPKLAGVDTGGQAFAEDERLTWHPNAGALATLHAEGKVTVFPAIGYTGVTQSHFTSRHFWEVGELDVHARSGWLGRYLDLHGSPDNPLQGLSLSNVLLPSLATVKVPVASVSAPSEYSLPVAGVDAAMQARTRAAYGALAAPSSNSMSLAYARRSAGDAVGLHDQLTAFRSFTSPVTYPNHVFPQRLQALAAMIAAGLPLRCVAFGSEMGWDHHAGQVGAFGRQIQVLGDSLLAFQRDLEARGLQDRVLVNVWSEFGRRAAENGANGSDHGAAGFSLLIGSRASGRMVGEFPGLTNLDAEGNLRPTSDFRGLYRGLLEQWLGADAEPIIPGAAGYASPVLLK
jgi:uncharacterized protein (DUF1501 family)